MGRVSLFVNILTYERIANASWGGAEVGLVDSIAARVISSKGREDGRGGIQVAELFQVPLVVLGSAHDHGGGISL